MSEPITREEAIRRIFSGEWDRLTVREVREQFPLIDAADLNSEKQVVVENTRIDHAHRVEWVAECHCATDGSHYQGYKCLDCGERLADARSGKVE